MPALFYIHMNILQGYILDGNRANVTSFVSQRSPLLGIFPYCTSTEEVCTRTLFCELYWGYTDNIRLWQSNMANSLCLNIYYCLKLNSPKQISWKLRQISNFFYFKVLFSMNVFTLYRIPLISNTHYKKGQTCSTLQ